VTKTGATTILEFEKATNYPKGTWIEPYKKMQKRAHIMETFN
jgi:hypothetical protein